MKRLIIFSILVLAICGASFAESSRAIRAGEIRAQISTRRLQRKFLSQNIARIPGPGGHAPSGGGGGSALVVENSVSVDSPLAEIDLGSAVNAAGDLVILEITTGSSAVTVTSICDSTTSGGCTSSASAYTIGTQVVEPTTGTIGSTFAWTCNATAAVRFFTIGKSGGSDVTVTILDVKHNVTSGCADATASATTASAVASLTSSPFTTTTANEIAVVLMADDSNCGPTWLTSSGFPTGAPGAGFTLGPIASTCSSMLGANEFQIFSSIQTGVTASINSGNSAGNPLAMALATFK